MKDQLVSYEVAVIAKEKGFDEITNLNHISEGNSYFAKGSIIDNFNELKHSDGDNYFVSAPTQSLLQRWLREIHGIYVFINYVKNEKFNYEVNAFQRVTCDQGFRGTWEQALEAGLLEALKLI